MFARFYTMLDEKGKLLPWPFPSTETLIPGSKFDIIDGRCRIYDSNDIELCSISVEEIEITGGNVYISGTRMIDGRNVKTDICAVCFGQVEKEIQTRFRKD